MSSYRRTYHPVLCHRHTVFSCVAYPECPDHVTSDVPFLGNELVDRSRVRVSACTILGRCHRNIGVVTQPVLFLPQINHVFCCQVRFNFRAISCCIREFGNPCTQRHNVLGTQLLPSLQMAFATVPSTLTRILIAVFAGTAESLFFGQQVYFHLVSFGTNLSLCKTKFAGTSPRSYVGKPFLQKAYFFLVPDCVFAFLHNNYYIMFRLLMQPFFVMGCINVYCLLYYDDIKLVKGVQK